LLGLNQIEEKKMETVMDTPDKAHLFYNNGVVVVTKKTIDLIPFEEFPSWVWADQVIDRDFIKSEKDDCDWKTMIRDFASDEPDRVSSIESTIGYLLHSYKDKANSPAVIINDEEISDDPEGGTGKSMFADAISQIKNRVKIDGKGFDEKNRFSYQTVKTDTQVLEFDDVNHKFPFDSLFSIITGGITLEYKGQTAIKIEFEDSPKIIISTNHSIPGRGNSHERRRWELEFSKYYSKGGVTPIQKFGRRLFDEWDDKDWIAFDNYMINCLQYFLNNGLVESRFKNLLQRKFHQSTTSDFAEWAEDKDNVFTKVPEATRSLPEMFNNFITDNPDYRNMRRSLFGKWIVRYGEYAFNCKPKKGRDQFGTTYKFIDKRPRGKQEKLKV
jgi:hypothetical protein